MSENSAIEVCNLLKRFREITAVDHVSFQVQPGEVLGLLGPNGAGKTTILHLILGLITPTSGDIRAFGKSIATNRREILQRVNFSSAYSLLPTNLTVRENLTIFARLYRVPNVKHRISEVLELFEIESSADKLTGFLSSGQLSRVNLCKAFLNHPEILFLDEPTVGLDPDIALKVRHRLQELQRDRNLTMIYTSHNMREIESLCTRVIFLSKGRIVAEGSPEEIVAKSQSNSLEDVFLAIAREQEHSHDIPKQGATK